MEYSDPKVTRYTPTEFAARCNEYCSGGMFDELGLILRFRDEERESYNRVRFEPRTIVDFTVKVERMDPNTNYDFRDANAAQSSKPLEVFKRRKGVRQLCVIDGSWRVDFINPKDPRHSARYSVLAKVKSGERVTKLDTSLFRIVVTHVPPHRMDGDSI